MRVTEANRRAAELLSIATEEEEQSRVSYAEGREAWAATLMTRSLLHASLATATMLTYGAVFTVETE